jgi:hypothetical protein
VCTPNKEANPVQGAFYAWPFHIGFDAEMHGAGSFGWFSSISCMSALLIALLNWTCHSMDCASASSIGSTGFHLSYQWDLQGLSDWGHHQMNDSTALNICCMSTH